MKTSEQIDQLATALSAAQAEMGGAKKDSQNPFYKSTYADLASVWEAIRAPISKHGLSVLQLPQTLYAGAPEIYEWTSRQGETRLGVKVLCEVIVVTRLCHTSGQWIEDQVSAMLPSADPQAIGSAITYLKRYSLAGMGIAPIDDDAESAQMRGAQQPPDRQEPTGYRDWLDDMTAVTSEGTKALQAAWKTSKVEYRSYLTSTAKDTWEAMKTKAAQQNQVLTSEL